MGNDSTVISIEQLLKQDIPELIGFNKNVVMINNLAHIKMLSHPVRLKAITVLVCIQGEIECSININRYKLVKNSLMICFSSDIIHIY
ncbi:MAG: hypothetical protein ACI4A8_00085, partial [Muribaculaceae bacterium]